MRPLPGVTQGQLDILASILAGRLAPFGARVFAFGSRVTGQHRADSDLDLWIESANPITLATLGALRGELEESSLPFKVDLIDQHRAPPALRERPESVELALR